jgi:hypothetical protein
MPAPRRSTKPVWAIIVIIQYALLAGWFACYWYVAKYGGTMPPQGSFDDYISDTWVFLSTGFMAPIFATLITRWILSKKTRSVDR